MFMIFPLFVKAGIAQVVAQTLFPAYPGLERRFERDFFQCEKSMRLLFYKFSPFKAAGRYKYAKNDISCRRR